MTRQTRTLVLVGAIALVGLFALGALARRYAGMTPSKSVADLPPAVPHSSIEDTAPAPAPSPAVPPAVVTEEPSAPAAAPVDPAVRQVEAFAAVRADLQAYHRERPLLARQWLGEMQGTATGKNKLQNFTKLVGFRSVKENALTREGIDLETYNRVRESYRAWLEGRPVPDPALAAALEARRERLEEVSLGDYEPIDF